MSANIALQLYTLREQANEDFTGMLADVAGAGYEAVEFAGYGGLSATVLREVIDDLGLRAISSHVPLRRMEAEPDRVLAELNVLGCDFVVVPGIPREMRGAESVPYLAERFDTWGEASRAAGLRFGYHNHAWEFEPLDGSTMFDLLAEKTDPGLVDLQIDIFWALVAGRDVVELIQRHAGRLPTLHAKELASHGSPKDTTVGDGVTPWPEVMAAANAAGTEWFIVEQEDATANAPRDIRRSLTNLRQIIADADAIPAG